MEAKKMSLEKRIKRAYENLKAPKGMFAVGVWDPSNPEKSIPYIVETETTKRDAVYSSEKYAKWYAKLRDKKWKKEYQEANEEKKAYMCEEDYFVVNEKGVKIY